MTAETLTILLLRLQTRNVRSLAERFREVYPEIEASLQAGKTRHAVLNELHAGGLFITFNGLKSNLRLTRQLHRNAQASHTARRTSKSSLTAVSSKPDATANPVD